ncbi:MAG: 6-phosphogluconolactonase [gamma proteobacterium symbiont of Bathyaustriella thionipta]|nr:6-phosphogluconolactonase [gamma proteobacterium symbiont of Bathyaustriella thionipta]
MIAQQNIRWHPQADAQAIAGYAARHILASAQQAISAQGAFSLVLAGGRTPEKTYRLLAEAGADWSKWHIYFGDERCLPADHAERNSRMAENVWLNKVDIPAENIHVIHAEKGAEVAAAEYAEVLQEALPFSLVLLGMGEDGHTASLFPGHQQAESEWVHAVHDAPKPPADRVSLSRRALAATSGLMVLISGAGKRQALQAWCNGEDLPVASIQPACGVDVVLDLPLPAS